MAIAQTNSAGVSPAFAVGSLVSVRGRDWVVLPAAEPDIMRLQPLGGSVDDVTGIFLPLEGAQVTSAAFPLPQGSQAGDARSCRLLREAARLGFRSGAGPFRSFGAIAVEPRPYQLVPLLMALRQDPMRLLIADDVGIGKTIEAGLIAREMLDRGEIERLTVLCPPHLTDQWVAELREKFHIEAAAVLSSTARSLEKNCAMGESLFQYHPFTVVSLDFIKSERRRQEFLMQCPELVIVDEAHTCADAGGGAAQQRHRLLKDIAAKADQHLLLVTATPHSGNSDAFRSLLSLLKPQFSALPDDLSGDHNANLRRDLARHLVQRRRADVRGYAEDTTFPQRTENELGYHLSPEYKKFFERVLAYVRESVSDETGGQFRQRVRWWAALGLLRALASSPAAAAATLEARARNADEYAFSLEEADEIGRRGIFDLDDENSATADLTPGAIVEPEDGEAGTEAESGTNFPSSREARRLKELANAARLLSGAKDQKLAKATEAVKQLLNEGYSPIVFCRFVATATEVRDHLRAKLPGVQVAAVTGLLSPEDRRAEVEQLASATQDGARRVLVATDCLSEGINLQAYFDAVLHYDLAWNPTRHEQREGRVDRFGQRKPEVRITTLYGIDNQIDGLILDVLLRKGKQIQRSLGVSIPVPTNSDAVAEAIIQGLLLRKGNVSSDQLALWDDLDAKRQDFHLQWEAAGDRERRSRTMFAQHSLKPEDIREDVQAMRRALGGSAEVEAFVRGALAALSLPVSPGPVLAIEPKSLPAGITDALRGAMPASQLKARIEARFDTASAQNETLLGRTHPLVATLAGYVMESALDPLARERLAHRCGAMRTDAVTQRTTLLLLRLRFHIHQKTARSPERALLAEDCLLLAFQGSAAQAQWLEQGEVEALLAAKPVGNVTPDQAARFVDGVTEQFEQLTPHLKQAMQERADELLAAHKRARDAAQAGGSVRVEAHTTPDVLGLWVFLPPLRG